MASETAGIPEGEGGSFADRLDAAIRTRNSCLVVGLDPVLARLPREVLGRAGTIARGDPGWTAHASLAVAFFLEGVIEAVADCAVAVKPNTAFFERFGAAGWDVLRRISERARRHGLLVVCDAKRGDIGSTAEAYAEALLGDVPDTLGPVTDAVTLNPYLGRDSIEPFLPWVVDRGKGLFILVRTSNPSAGEFQDLDAGGEPLYLKVARSVGRWGEGLGGTSGLAPIGAVAGATAPRQLEGVREALPGAFLLVPGYGAQGARAEDLRPCFLPGGRGAVVNASRSILYAFEERGGDWRQAVREAAARARDELEAVRARA